MATKTPKLTVGLVLDSSLDLEDGVQQYVMTVGEWLRSQGHDVHYLVGQTESRNLPNIHSLARNFVVTFNGNRVNIPLMARRGLIKRLFRDITFDVLHVQTPHHPLLAQRIIKAAPRDVAVVASFHILPYGRVARLANTALGWWLRPSLKRVDKMLAVSSAAATFEEKVFGLPVTVSPNVFDYESFHTAVPLKRYDDDIKTILFLGRLVRRKGCLTLLRAAVLLRQEADLPAFRIIICGKGELSESLKNFARENGLEDVVEFTGFILDEDKPGYLASSDISVFPSSGGESFGIVLLEAMASGQAAVLAGDNPGYASVMEPRPELLFDPEDPEALAEKLRMLLTDEPRRQALAAWGADYTKDFDVNVVGSGLVDLYRDLIEAKNVR